MTIIEDTRQQVGKHEHKHTQFNELGVQVVRSALPFGDYIKCPPISIDTKKNMEEIAQNIGSDHKRFKNECIKARDAGCQLVILIENNLGIKSVEDVHKWVNPRILYSPKAINGERLQKAMLTMSERYGVRFEFCAPNEAAAKILELLGDKEDE